MRVIDRPDIRPLSYMGEAERLQKLVEAKKPTKEPDSILMLRVLETCIRNRILPARSSPCHKRIRMIIRDWKKGVKR